MPCAPAITARPR